MVGKDLMSGNDAVAVFVWLAVGVMFYCMGVSGVFLIDSQCFNLLVCAGWEWEGSRELRRIASVALCSIS
jgi:hypothetical protein